MSGALVAGHVARAAADPSTSWLWVHELGPSNGASGQGVAVDASGDSYVTGDTAGTLPGSAEAYGGAADVFVAKYDALGDRLWVHDLGSTASEVGNGIAVDASGNSYVTGYTMGTLPGSPDTNAGGQDVFVAKFDPAGNPAWVHQFGSTLDDVGNGIAVDASGNTYVTGQTDGTLPGSPDPSAARLDAFVTMYDTAGNQLWVRQFGSFYDDVGKGVAVDTSGNGYLTGWTDGMLPGSPESGGQDAFVAKYDNAGDRLWVHQLGDASAGTVGEGIGVDASGNSYVGGDTSAMLAGPGETGHGLLAKYDTTGAKVWVHEIGAPPTADDDPFAVAVDGAGNSYLTGWVQGTLPGSPETNSGDADAFVVKYDTAGNPLWVHQLGSKRYAAGYGIGVDASGNAYVTGATFATLPGSAESNAGNDAVFLAKVGEATADLSITASASPKSVKADGTVVVRLVVTNNGPLNATAVSVGDSFPLSVQPVSATTSQGTCTLGRPVTCALGTVKTGKTAKVNVTLQPILPGTITATATVDSAFTDPNTANNTAAVNVTVTAAPQTKYVTVSDATMTPASLKVALGTTVQWDFLGTTNHDVTDSTGMGLYASGSEAPGSDYAFTFTGAGVYAYTSAEDTPGFGGMVTVAPTISPASGTTSTAFTVTWATSPPPTGYAFDILIQRPTGGYTNYATATTDQAVGFTPDAGTGTYRFRVRLRHTADDTASQYATSGPVTAT